MFFLSAAQNASRARGYGGVKLPLARSLEGKRSRKRHKKQTRFGSLDGRRKRLGQESLMTALRKTLIPLSSLQTYDFQGAVVCIELRSRFSFMLFSFPFQVILFIHFTVYFSCLSSPRTYHGTKIRTESFNPSLSIHYFITFTFYSAVLLS